MRNPYEAANIETAREFQGLLPGPPHHAVRLLVATPDGGVIDTELSHLREHLSRGDVLMLDGSPEVPIRLTAGRLPRGFGLRRVTIEIVLKQRVASDRFAASARPANKLYAGDTLFFGRNLEARVLSWSDGRVELLFDQSGGELDRTIAQIGEALDLEASAAGFLSPELAEQVRQDGIELLTVTAPPDGYDSAIDFSSAGHPEEMGLSTDLAARLNAVRARGGCIAATGPRALLALENATSQTGEPRSRKSSFEKKLRLGPAEILMASFRIFSSPL